MHKKFLLLSFFLCKKNPGGFPPGYRQSLHSGNRQWHTCCQSLEDIRPAATYKWPAAVQSQETVATALR